MACFLKNIFYFFIPFGIILLVYVYLDPFMVIYKYENFYEEQIIPTVLDRDYVSTSTYINNRKKYNYNNFIFGNSRSRYYKVTDWGKHIDGCEHCFHFDASGESLYAMCRKIQFIDECGDSIKNALFVIDHQLLCQSTPYRKSHLFFLSPQIDGHFFYFHMSHLKSFMNYKFFYAVCDYYINREIKDYMKNENLLYIRTVTYNLKSNELQQRHHEKLIADGLYYNTERMKTFQDKQTPITSEPVIFEENKKLLVNMKKILDKHHTNFKIIISPLYYQIKLNPKDLSILIKIFGSDNVFDFSGVNDITKDYHNYYEDSHYRPHVATFIMNKIYAEDDSILTNDGIEKNGSIQIKH